MNERMKPENFLNLLLIRIGTGRNSKGIQFYDASMYRNIKLKAASIVLFQRTIIFLYVWNIFFNMLVR